MIKRRVFNKAPKLSIFLKQVAGRTGHGGAYHQHQQPPQQMMQQPQGQPFGGDGNSGGGGISLRQRSIRKAAQPNFQPPPNMSVSTFLIEFHKVEKKNQSMMMRWLIFKGYYIYFIPNIKY